jgi:hypothetical protein
MSVKKRTANNLLIFLRFISQPSFLQKRICARLILTALTPSPFQLVALPVDLGLIPANVVVLSVGLIFLALELMSDKSAGA